MGIHFIADLHLQPSRPQLTTIARRYLQGPAQSAEALYILGDLFEYWIGDDGSMRDYPGIIADLSALTAAGVPVYFMHGNRDFAVNGDFAAATGVRILPDPTVIDLHGVHIALSHGDRLCTDDIAHQRFRARYTDPEWLQRMLRYPVFVRRLLARYARWRSQRGHDGKPEAIMDVNADTVDAFMREHGVSCLIHGHTHRPADHDLAGGAQRLVLADWHDDRGEVLVCEAGTHTRLALA